MQLDTKQGREEQQKTTQAAAVNFGAACPQPGIVYRWPMRCRLVWGMLSCVRFCWGRLNERCVASKGRSCMSRAQKRQFYKPGGAASAIRGVTVWVNCDYLHGTSGCRSRLG